MNTFKCACGDHVFAPTKTQGGTILVSPEDEYLLRDRTWTAGRHRNGFRAHWNPNRPGEPGVKLHQLITGERGRDHKNRNGLDNRRSNLRRASASENGQNRKATRHSSKYHGVSFEPWTGKWRASIGLDRKTIKLGRFIDEVLAAQAYDASARRIYGRDAFLNFPDIPVIPNRRRRPISQYEDAEL